MVKIRHRTVVRGARRACSRDNSSIFKIPVSNRDKIGKLQRSREAKKKMPTVRSTARILSTHREENQKYAAKGR